MTTELKAKKVYSISKIKKLYKSIETHLTYEEQEILKEIISDFNGLICYAKDRKEYIKSKEDEWLHNMNENHRLIKENKELKEKIQHQKNTIEYLKETFKKS